MNTQTHAVNFGEGSISVGDWSYSPMTSGDLLPLTSRPKPPHVTWEALLRFPVTTKDNINKESVCDEDITTSTPIPNDEDLLELVYQQVLLNQNHPALFLEQIDRIDWYNKGSKTFEQAIQMAISLECVTVARQLVKQGRRQYPNSNTLKELANVLAPPRVIERSGPTKGLSAFMEWFEQHAEEHRGLWVALFEGNFLGAAPSREILIEQLGDVGSDPDIIISLLP